MEEERNQIEDEINLMDYVKVILKRKKLILGWFLGLAIIAGVFSFLMPKVYKIDTSLEIGKIESTIETIQDQLIESPIQLVGKIDGDVYGTKVRNELDISELEWPKIKVENPKGTELVKIIIESKESDKAKDILEKINNLILEDHQNIIDSKKELLEKNIGITEEKIGLNENNIININSKISALDEDIFRIENKIDYSEEEKTSLEGKVGALEKVLIYEQTPGTQFALFDTKEKLADKKQEIEDLFLQINSLKKDKESFKIDVNSYESSIASLNADINSLKASLENIKPTKVIKSPIVSETPVSPKKKLNIIIAGILGLFIGVFWAFGKEWWEQNK